MAIPHPVVELKQRMKVLEEQVGVLLEEVRVLKGRPNLQPNNTEADSSRLDQVHIIEQLRLQLQQKEEELQQEKAEKEEMKSSFEKRERQLKMELKNHSSVCQNSTWFLESLPQNHSAKLMAAAEAGDAAAVKLVIDMGVSVRATEATGKSALHLAATRGHIDTVQVLLDAGAEVDYGICCGYTPLVVAAYAGHMDVCRALIAAGARTCNNYNPNSFQYNDWILHYAAYKGRLELCELLLNSGAMINGRRPDGWTALHGAARFGRADVVRLLLQQGASHCLDSRGITPLDLARHYGNTEVVALLTAAAVS